MNSSPEEALFALALEKSVEKRVSRVAMKILRFPLSLSLLALGWAGPRLCAQAPAAAAGYDVAVTKNVMVAMRDGVRLATDIYLPARNGVPVEGKFPVILERTPYTKERPAASNRVFVAHGYVVVCQDVRGRYASEGRWRPLRDDPNDGFDTAQWIGAQPWSNQRIGTVGFRGVGFEGGAVHGEDAVAEDTEKWRRGDAETAATDLESVLCY